VTDNRDDMDEEERVNLAKLDALRAAIAEGIASGPGTGGETVFARLRQRVLNRAAEKKDRTHD
jgi:hypothetical protein